MTTKDPCTCETTGHCAACRPTEIHPLRMTDAQFDRWIASRTPDQHEATMQTIADRFEDDGPKLTPEHLAVRTAMDGDPEAFPDRWLDPEHPKRLTREASRMYAETLRVY